jgi:hypothetical protein
LRKEGRLSGSVFQQSSITSSLLKHGGQSFVEPLSLCLSRACVMQ